MAEEQLKVAGAEGSTQPNADQKPAQGSSVVQTPEQKPDKKPEQKPNEKDPLAAGSPVGDAITKPAEETPPAEADLSYPEYQYEEANSIVNTLKNAKVPVVKAKEIFAEAVQSRDPSKINKAELEKLVGKDAAELTIMRVEKLVAVRTAAIKESVDAIHSVFGSKELSDKAFAWANAKAKDDPEFKAQYTEFVSMLDKSKTQAVLAAEAVKRAFESDPNNSSLSVKMVNGEKSATVIADNAKLTRAQYLEAVKAAHNAGDYKEVERLQKIRLQSMREAD